MRARKTASSDETHSQLPEDAVAVADPENASDVQSELANAWSAVRHAEEAAHDLWEGVERDENQAGREAIAQLFTMLRLARRHMANAAQEIEDDGVPAAIDAEREPTRVAS